MHCSRIALSEFVWVLENRFGMQRREVIAALRVLLATRNLTFDRVDAVKAAVDAFEAGGAEFPDFLIAQDNLAAGCSVTLTLDHKAARKPGFTHLRS